MDKFKNINVKKYTFDTKLKTSSPSIDKQCFAFGYLDGYFKEEVYEDFLEVKECMFVAYNLGYKQGEEARFLATSTKEGKEKWELEKQTWLKSLAKFDINNFEGHRRFSLNSRPFYEKYQEEALENVEIKGKDLVK